jgi:DNA-binding SARP family transcriptional activator
MVETLLYSGYAYLLTGYKNKALQTAEQAYTYITNSSVSLIHRCTLLTLLHNICFEQGDETNTVRHKALILQIFGSKALQKTIIGSSLQIWDISMAISSGKYKQAAQLLSRSNTPELLSQTPHILSQFLQWQAYLAAHNGEHAKTIATGNESLRLRKIAGGPFFIIRNLMVLGGSHTLIKSYEAADKFLSQAMQLAQAHNYPSHQIALNIHRGFLFIQTGQEDEAKKVILSGLLMMRENGYTCFMSWSPAIVLPVLQFAVDMNIEKKYALFLAKEQMQEDLQKQDVPIPLLSISLFGDIKLTIKEETIVRSDDLTPAWRQILSILILSENQQVTSRVLQISLWPEKSPEKARRAMDTQLSRLKKFLSQKCSVHNYLTNSKGIIKLRHCKVDIHEFIDFTEQGFTHIDKLEWWQAENCFYNATQIWNTSGVFNSELLGCEQAYTQKLQLTNLYIKMILIWSKHLHEIRKRTEALELLETGMTYYPDHIDLVTALFSLHLQNNNAQDAQNVLDQFTHFLHLKKYSDQEIRKIRTNILTHAEQTQTKQHSVAHA